MKDRGSFFVPNQGPIKKRCYICGSFLKREERKHQPLWGSIVKDLWICPKGCRPGTEIKSISKGGERLW